MAQIKKWLIVCSFFLMLSAASFAENPVQDLFFELTRLCLRGVSPLPAEAPLIALTRPAAQLFALPVWRSYRAYPLSFIEYLCPEKLGVLDSTFSAADLFGMDSQEQGLSADWLDSALLAIKMRSLNQQEPEPFDVAEQMLSQMDNRDEGGIVEGQDEKNEEAVERTFTDSSGRIRRFSYGVEQLAVREKDGLKTLIDSADGLTIRCFYDEHNRMVKKERFMVGSSARSLQLLSSRVYAYNGDAILPYQMTEDVASGNKHSVTTYDERGLVVTLEAAHYEKPEEKQKKEGQPASEAKLIKDRTNFWSYDDEKRITEERVITYYYSKTTTGRQKIEENQVRRVYDYTGIGRNPDYFYYENGELRIHTVYESENVYNETMYFDDGFTVLARYENNAKRLEIVSVNGMELRRRVF